MMKFLALTLYLLSGITLTLILSTAIIGYFHELNLQGFNLVISNGCCLYSSTLGPRPSVPQPSASISLTLSPQSIARLNTKLLFNFEVVITLKR